jgi:urease accessory protein UreH
VAAAGRDSFRRERRCAPPSPEASSTLLAWELLCLGRPVIGEAFSHGTLESRLEVWVDGSPLIERLTWRRHLARAGQPWVGTLLFYPANETLLEGVRERLAPLQTLPAQRSPTACCRCVFSVTIT